MKRLVFLIMGVFIAIAIYSELHPEQAAMDTYQAYRDAMIAGRSFDEDATFYTEARQAEIRARIAESDNADLMIKAYLDLTQKQAECSDLTLAEEMVGDDQVRLVYDVTDTCGTYDEGTKVREIVELVKEGGVWKIRTTETSISN